MLQGLDASGKDGVIRRVFDGVNPTGLSASRRSRRPVGAELQHDYLWRIHAALPARGEIGIFNRSHYEDVVAVRMPDSRRRRSGAGAPSTSARSSACSSTRGRRSLKVFLNVSKEEQRKRFQERIDDPEKRWKFRRDDLEVRERFDEWVAAWDEALTETSTAWAPWYVVPADRNWVKAIAVAELVAATLERLDPQLPEPEPGLERLRIE